MKHERPRLPWFLREWREYRKLTQEKLAERVGMTQGMISHLETGKVEFTSYHLDIFSEILNCKPKELLDRNPFDPEPPWSIWEELPSAQQLQAIEILKVLKKTDGD